MIAIMTNKVRRPDDSTATGLEAVPHTIANDWTYRPYLTVCDPHWNIPDGIRSVTFGLTENQRFSIEGRVGEFDVAQTTYHWNYFGGIDGTPALVNAQEVLGVFEGQDVKSDTIKHLSFEFDDPDWNAEDDFSTAGCAGPCTEAVEPGNGEIFATYIVE